MEYCNSEDVRKRLSTAGYKFAADRDRSGVVSTTEIADTITPAIEYAGNLIDACVLRVGCQPAAARGSGNQWLRDRAIDLAAYRVSTTGGRGIIQTLKDDADAAMSMIQRTQVVPGLQYQYPQSAPQSARFPRAINVR